jgi:beta-N-acetylglucosaminidase
MENEKTNQLTVYDELKNLLTSIKDKIKTSNMEKSVFLELTKSAKIIQEKLNDLLKKKGVLTQSDIDDAYIILQEQQREVFEKKIKNNNKKILIFSVIGIALISYFYFYKKK